MLTTCVCMLLLLLPQAPILFKGVAATVPSSAELVSTARHSVDAAVGLPATRPPAQLQATMQQLPLGCRQGSHCTFWLCCTSLLCILAAHPCCTRSTQPPATTCRWPFVPADARSCCPLPRCLQVTVALSGEASSYSHDPKKAMPEPPSLPVGGTAALVSLVQVRE